MQSHKTNMVPIVQLVRASDCGSECRGFESHWAPRKSDFERSRSFFVQSYKGNKSPCILYKKQKFLKEREKSDGEKAVYQGNQESSRYLYAKT